MNLRTMRVRPVRLPSVRVLPITAVASLALALLSTGCGNNSSSTSTPATPADAPAADASQGTIGVSLLTSTNPFFITMGQSIQQEATANHMQAIVQSADYDPVKQNDEVNDYIAKKVSAIVLNPADSRAIGTAIIAANKAGIPVFTADIASLSKDAKVVTHIATDNLAGGRLAGQAMIEALNGNGKVAILDNPVTESVMMRTQGFEEVINKHNATGPGKIDIVVKLPGGGEKDKSFKATEDIMQSHPDVNGIFAINDPSALGAVAALEKDNKASQVKIVGFDGQPEGKQAIKDGKIYADPIQFPDQIGKITVQCIVKYMKGETLPDHILIPTRLYKKADALADKSLTAP
jgi:ribose transport system substrate-binding protein